MRITHPYTPCIIVEHVYRINNIIVLFVVHNNIYLLRLPEKKLLASESASWPRTTTAGWSATAHIRNTSGLTAMSWYRESSYYAWQRWVGVPVDFTQRPASTTPVNRGDEPHRWTAKCSCTCPCRDAHVRFDGRHYRHYPCGQHWFTTHVRKKYRYGCVGGCRLLLRYGCCLSWTRKKIRQVLYEENAPDVCCWRTARNVCDWLPDRIMSVSSSERARSGRHHRARDRPPHHRVRRTIIVDHLQHNNHDHRDDRCRPTRDDLLSGRGGYFIANILCSHFHSKVHFGKSLNFP